MIDPQQKILGKANDHYVNGNYDEVCVTDPQQKILGKANDHYVINGNYDIEINIICLWFVFLILLFIRYFLVFVF